MTRRAAALALTILGGLAAAASAEEPATMPPAEAARHLVETFSARCLARGAQRAAFQDAGADLDRSAETKAALEKLQSQRSSLGEVHDSGALAEPFPMWIVVGTGRLPNAPEAGSCELIWSGTFPDGLPAALAKRLGRASNPADPFGDAIVYAYPPVAGGKDAAARGLILLAKKPPLHSIVLLLPLG